MQYDSIADDYNSDIAKDLNQDKLEFELIDLTGISNPKDWKVLDLGCGSGIQMEFLAKRFHQIKSLTGVDSSENLVNLARSNTKDRRCSYVVSDMHKLPLDNEYFDFIYSRYAIHYSSNISTILAELDRALKPGGTIYLQVVHPIYELFKKESRDYESPEEAVFTPQTTTLRVVHVTHTVSQYINAVAQSELELTNIEERFGRHSNIDSYRVPTILILRLHKKTLLAK